MNPREKLEKLLDGSLGRRIDRIEDARLAQEREIERFMIVSILAGLAWAISCSLVFNPLAGVASAIAAVACALYMRKSRETDFRERFRREVVPAILGTLADKTDFDPAYGLSGSEFVSMGLYQVPDNYESWSGMTGVSGKTRFYLCSAFAEEEREEEVMEYVSETDIDGNIETRTEWHTETCYYTIFEGAILKAQFNKPLRGWTAVRQDGRGNIHLEDPEFAGRFAVSANDQVESRFVLSPRMMERIKRLQRRVGRFEMAFTDGFVYVALPGRERFCRPEAPYDRAEARRLHGKMASILAIIEDLDLNTRLWTVGLEDRFEKMRKTASSR